jgi:hypothetical protein
MKQILKFGILIFIGFFAFASSCTKDVFTEEDAYANQEDLEVLKDSLALAQAAMDHEYAMEMELLRDSLKKAGGIIDYSVVAVLATDASWLSYSYPEKGNNSGKGGTGMDGVTVTVSQYGQLLTSTTNASGIATFSDLRIGSVTVNVQKTGYCEVDFIAVLPALPDSVYTEAYSLVRQAGTMVPMFSLSDDLSTISGIATVETDLTNDAPEPAANVKVTATIDVADYDFIYKYIQLPYYDVVECDYCSFWEFDYYALIRQIAFHSTVFETTTAADGSFTLQVPSTPDGLPYELSADEFATNQSLLQATLNSVPVWGVQTIRTMFGPPSAMTYSTIPTNGTELSNVQSAYVTFSAPTGTPDAQPTTEAEAYAVLTSSGIVSINMIYQGEGYTQAPRVTIAPGTGYNPVQAEGTAVVSGGKVTGVTITNAGSGYLPDDDPAITFIETVERTAVAVPEFSFSVIDVAMDDYGSGYSQTAPTVTIVGSGTGATAHAVMAAWLTDITITAMGSGYTDTAIVVISDNFGAEVNATALMTEYNPLYSIDYDGTNTQLWPASPIPTATIGDIGDGTGATANVTLSSVGEVVSTTSLVGGSGYTTAPVVTISGGGGFGATATASVTAGAVTGISIDDNGQGYTSIPTITFTGGGGTGASATAVLGFPVEDITMVEAGLGYSDASISLDNGTIGPIDYTNDCVVKYNMKVRDITFTPGSDYFTAAPTVTILPIDGNGTGATATAEVTWGILDIELDTQGSGYMDNDENDVMVQIDPPAGAGTQATATATLDDGVLSDVILVEFGQGYTASPNVFIMEESEGDIIPTVTSAAQISATVSNGQVTGLTIDDPGSGYDFDTYANGYYYIDITTFNSDAEAEAQANPESGQIDYIQITNPGAGYVVAPKVEIVNPADTATGNGFGSGATATATIVDGRVAEITVTNPGSGYYVTPDVNITVPYSSMTAVGRCDVTDDGRIEGVEFSGGYPFTQGFGYDTPPTLTFTASIPGKGSGAEGVAVVNAGRVTNVIMTNQGSGYTGKNNPGSTQNSAFNPSSSVTATAGKAYVRDLNFGTGRRTVED